MPLTDSGCLFIHIPKCAGTSIEMSLGIADAYPEIGLRPTSTQPDLSHLFGAGMQHLTVREIRENFADVLQDRVRYEFSVVREPVDRLVSHFVWKEFRFNDAVSFNQSVLDAFLSLVVDVRDFSKSFRAFRHPYEGHTFCEGLGDTLGLNDIRRHLLPQCAFLFDRGGLAVRRLFNIKETKSLEAYLLARGDLKRPLERRMANKLSATLRRALPISVVDEIEDIYAMDVDLLARFGQVDGMRLMVNDSGNTAGAPTKTHAQCVSDCSIGREVPRIINLYWHQGWDVAPALVKRCAESWRRRNSDWSVRLLDQSDLATLGLPDQYSRLRLPIPALSDVIRIYLLAHAGGVWADATTWCCRPLDQWLDQVASLSGFFAYAQPAPDRPLASWFLASRPSNPIARKWKDATDEFWSRAAAKGGATNVADDPGSIDYFWFHGLFQNLLDTDTEVEALWRKTPQVSADGPHYLQQRGLVSAADDAVRLHVYNKSTNVYKLSRRIDLPDRLEGSVLSALFDTLS